MIKDAEILVGMRMHSTILGACASVPIVGLYYQQKGRTFFEALGLDDLMIDIEQVSFENLSSMIAGVLSDRDKIIHRLQDNLPLQRNKVRETVKYFKEEYFQR